MADGGEDSDRGLMEANCPKREEERRHTFALKIIQYFYLCSWFVMRKGHLGLVDILVPTFSYYYFPITMHDRNYKMNVKSIGKWK